MVSGGARLDSRSSHCLYWLKVLVILLVPRERIVNLKVQDNSLLSDPFQFSIYQSSYLRRYCLRSWHCSKINHYIKITQLFISRFLRSSPYTCLSTKSRMPCFFIVATRPANRNLIVSTLTNNTWRTLTPLFATYWQHPNIFLVMMSFHSVTANATFQSRTKQQTKLLFYLCYFLFSKHVCKKLDVWFINCCLTQCNFQPQSKLVPVQNIKAYRRSRGTAPHIRNVSSIGRWVISFTPRQLLPHKECSTHWIGEKNHLLPHCRKLQIHIYFFLILPIALLLQEFPSKFYRPGCLLVECFDVTKHVAGSVCTVFMII